MPPAHMPHAAIADDLQARIEAGEYPPGSRLPTYRELAALYSVGQMTVTRALRILRERGLIEGHQGKGIYVTSTT